MFIRKITASLALAVSTLLTVAAPLTVMVVSGCAQMGVQAPQTFDERVAAGYVTAAGLVQVTDTLLAADKITIADAKAVSAQLDNAKLALDAAAKLHGQNPLEAQDKLSASILLLQQLQTYLQLKGK